MSLEEQMQIKMCLYDHCQKYVLGLLAEARRGVHESREAANLEEKSSAGDKFETHRAMMHLQMESFIKRSSVAESLEFQLSTLRIRPMSQVQLGALVETEERWYFIAVSAPSIEIGGIKYTCISTDAPLFHALQGAIAGDWIEWGEDEEEIEIVSVS